MNQSLTEEERNVAYFRNYLRYIFKGYIDNPYNLKHIHLCSDRNNEEKPTEELIVSGLMGRRPIPWHIITYDNFRKWDKKTEKKEIERRKPILYEEVDSFNTAWVKQELERRANEAK